MKIKFIFTLSFILNILIADSPITSTDFYKAYLSVPEVESARASGIINKQIANFLLNPEHTIDKKAAIINALSWDLNGKVNAILFNKYLYKKWHSRMQAWNIQISKNLFEKANVVYKK